ncbi:MAG: Brp/Blh family beta-carotene 15,15'-dioxygenase [Flavobacteriaceae bacterium]
MAIFLPFDYQNLIGALGILSVGILHGANDLAILVKRKKNTETGTPNYLAQYLGVIVLAAFIFYMLPALALLGFVLFSAYHFGEQHWETKEVKSITPFLFHLTYGLFIFFLLFSAQIEPVREVIYTITGYALSPMLFYGGLLTTAVLSFLMLLDKSKIRFLMWELLLWAILAIIFQYGSLIFAFAYYFVFWHSIPSLKEQLIYLYEKPSINALALYLKKAGLYWFLALVGLLTLLLTVDLQADYILPLFFTFLAAITFPHAVVMYMMFRDHRIDRKNHTKASSNPSGKLTL